MLDDRFDFFDLIVAVLIILELSSRESFLDLLLELENKFKDFILDSISSTFLTSFISLSSFILFSSLTFSNLTFKSLYLGLRISYFSITSRYLLLYSWASFLVFSS